MDILLVERDRLVRDQVKVGLQQFSEFSVTCGEGYGGVNLVRQHEFGVVFLGVPANMQEAKSMVEHLRSADQAVELVVLVPERMAKELASFKPRYNILSVLPTPLGVTDFFRLVARMRERRAQSADTVT